MLPQHSLPNAARIHSHTYSMLAKLFLINTHDWRQTLPLLQPSCWLFRLKAVCEYQGTLSWLQHRLPFILERQVSLFSGQALTVCSQGAFQPSSSSSLSFHPLWHPGTSLWWSLPVWIVLISLCTWGCLVMHISSISSRDKYVLRNTSFLFFLLQRNHYRVQTSPVLSECVDLQFSLGNTTVYLLVLYPLLNLRASVNLIRSMPGEEGGSLVPKTRVPGTGRNEKIRRLPFVDMWGSIEMQLLKRAWKHGNSKDKKCDLFSHTW